MAKQQAEALKVSIRVRPLLNAAEELLAERGDVVVQGNEIIIHAPRLPGRGELSSAGSFSSAGSLESRGGSFTSAGEPSPKIDRRGSLTTQLLSRSGLFKNVASNPQNSYKFGMVFSPEVGTEEVHRASGAEDIVQTVCEGCNGTIFVYGQTGTGKTHTIDGITEASIHQIFKHVEKLPAAKSTQVFVSVLELYNEQIRDLISGQDNLGLKAAGNNGITYVEGLSEESVDSAQRLLVTVATGKSARSVAETKANLRSSRGHLIVRVKIETIDKSIAGSQRVIFSTLNLVDLAGSERAEKAGTAENTLRFKESTNINKDLLMLGNVVTSLAERSEGKTRLHVPYRDSKLTRLLQDSLGGNARTALIACITTLGDWNMEQTRHTLDFAARAGRIVCEPRVNVAKLSGNHANELTALQSEIENLRRQLAQQTEEIQGLRSIMTTPIVSDQSIQEEAAMLVRIMEKEAEGDVVRSAGKRAKDTDSEEFQEVSADPGSWMGYPMPVAVLSPRLSAATSSALHSGTTANEAVLRELIALLDRKKAEVSTLRDRMDSFQNQHREDLEIERSSTLQQVAQLTSQLQTLSQERDQLQSSYTEQLDGRKEAEKASAEQLATVKRELDAVKDSERATALQLAVLRQEHDSLKVVEQGSAAQVTAYRKEVAALKEQVANSQQEAATYRGEIDILQAQLRESGGRVEESVERLKVRLSHVGALHTTVAVKDSVLHSQQNLMGDMSRRIHELQQSLNQSNAEREVLSKKLEAMSSGQPSLGSTVAAIKAMRKSRDTPRASLCTGEVPAVMTAMMAGITSGSIKSTTSEAPVPSSRLWSSDLGSSVVALVGTSMELASKLEKQITSCETNAAMAGNMEQLQGVLKELSVLSQQAEPSVSVSSSLQGATLLPVPPSQPDSSVSDVEAKVGTGTDDDFEIGFDPETEVDADKKKLWNRLRNLKAQNTMLRHNMSVKDRELALKSDTDARLRLELAQCNSALGAANQQVDTLLDEIEAMGKGAAVRQGSHSSGADRTSVLTLPQVQEQILGLWEDLSVPLTHRSAFVLPGRGGASLLNNRTYAVAELQRLKWLQQNGGSRAGRALLEKERKALVESWKAVPKADMAAHYNSVGIALKSKRRKEQLAAQVWTTGVPPDASAKAVAMAQPGGSVDIEAFYAVITARGRQ